MPDSTQAMGSDPHPFTPPNPSGAPAAPDQIRARPATTASMQNLLAQYFETQHFQEAAHDHAGLDAGHFEAARVHALSAVQSETRASAATMTMSAVPAAAFVPMPVKPTQSAPTPAPAAGAAATTVAEAAPDTSPSATAREWPVSARELIDRLMVENEKLREQMHALSLELREAQDMADNDVLTPTLNRRAFLREVGRAMADCKRYGEEACLIFLDMDGFKAINDTYGHSAGDAALNHVADVLKSSVRQGDAVGRMGGDEFAILL
ncbi:MAG: GGDEF domain-containing protein, partial [Asticcacaulis sp.]